MELAIAVYLPHRMNVNNFGDSTSVSVPAACGISLAHQASFFFFKLVNNEWRVK